MADLENNFNSTDFSLISPSGNVSGDFGNFRDYVKLTIRDEGNSIVNYDNNGVIQPAIFYSTVDSALEFPYQPAENPSFIIQTTGNISGSENRDIVIEGNSIGNGLTVEGNTGQFKVYENATNNGIYIKPNEILSSSALPEGNYNLQLDFLNQFPLAPAGNTAGDYGDSADRFVIKEISPSRKEVRIKLLDLPIAQQNPETELNTNLEQLIEPNVFNYVLNIGLGRHIPITNYIIDKFTNGGDNRSIILKLYEPLPSNLGTLQLITLEKEVLITQRQEIYYFSDVKGSPFGSGIIPDYNYPIESFEGDYSYDNYNELTSSLPTEVIESIYTGSSFDYPNLNVDFNKFENHIHFGSAERKLENFREKVKTIQLNLSTISSSLSGSRDKITSTPTSVDSDDLVQLRKTSFNKIQKEINSFTPYERFLYYDGQSHSTSSAPGLGRNYAATFAMNRDVDPGEGDDRTNQPIYHSKYSGLPSVYQIDTLVGAPTSQPFRNKYRIEDKPFFNYSGSVYLSFLVKGPTTYTQEQIVATGGGQENNWNVDPSYQVPRESNHFRFIKQHKISGSAYFHYVMVASSSHWIPNVNADFDTTTLLVEDLKQSDSNGKIDLITSHMKTGSSPIIVGGDYQNLATVVTGSGVPFVGSLLPMGDLFRINLGDSNADSADTAYFTDIKVTFENPTNIQPFGQLRHTSSLEWQSWYDGMIVSASSFDTDNIHSLENNLPTYIQESSEYNDMKKFLSLIGENFDLIRNHIDGLGDLHNRRYEKLESVPANLIPMVLNNLGWEAILPFSSSLADYFGSSVSSITNESTVSENTLRKVLNNLIYIYKSKGTKNSVRALLNTYGYPPDVLQIQEFGSSNEPQNGVAFTASNPAIGTTNLDTDLRSTPGNISFNNKKEKFYHFNITKDLGRNLGTDWWMDDANPNTVEFVYKHKNTTENQTILKSSGSGEHAATATINILSPTTAHHDGTLLVISSSDGTGKTYIFDDDNEGANGTVDGSGRVRIQISGAANIDEIATSISTSISSPNGHFGKIDVSDSINFLTDTSQFFVVSGGLRLLANSSGSIVLTQITGGRAGNNKITTTNASASITGFRAGTDNQTLWDLRLLQSSDGVSSSFEFRLNNSETGSNIITGSAVSMSTNYTEMKDGQLWNVMLQRMTSSTIGTGTNEYRLHNTLQEQDRIKKYNYITMSVSGALVGDTTSGGRGFFANQNWFLTGSRHYLSSSNLIFGNSMSGSVAQILTWTTALSSSKFRQHTLNKLSTVGNNIDAHKDELIYNFKLNENYTSASISSSLSGSQSTVTIMDSNPNGPLGSTTTDYSFGLNSGLVSGSLLYGYDVIDVYSIGLQDVGQNVKNDNKIIIKPNQTLINNLNPFQSSIKTLYQQHSRPKRTHSSKLDLSRSPQDFIDNFILDKIQGYNLETLYANPEERYSSSFSELDTFRDTFFRNYNVSVDMNRYIRGMENLFNESLIDGIRLTVPAKSTLSDVGSNIGVIIRPTILEKQKYEHEIKSIETNPNKFSGEIVIATGSISFTDSTLVLPKSGSINIITGSVSMLPGELMLPKSGSIDIITGSVKISNSELILPKSGSIAIVTGSVKISNSELILPKSGSIAIVTGSINITGSELLLPKSGSSISTLPNLTGSELILPKSGSDDYINTNNYSKFVDNHINWGTGKDDVHFLNMATSNAETSSNILIAAASATLTVADGDAASGMVEKEKVVIKAADGTTGTYAVIDDNATTVATGAVLASDSDVGATTASAALVGAIAVAINTTGTAATQNDFLVQLKAAIANANSPLNGKVTVSAVPGEANGAQSITLTQVTLGEAGNSAITTDISQLSTNNFTGGEDYRGGNYNNLHVDRRYTFHMAGDVEIYSGSKNKESDFSNQTRFFNRQMVSDYIHENITYDSYMHGNPGTQTGRAVGKTRYFFTSSGARTAIDVPATGSAGLGVGTEGVPNAVFGPGSGALFTAATITLPSNHVSLYRDPYVDLMYRGSSLPDGSSSDTNPTYLNVKNYEDYSTASFYRVKVTGGENEIRVISGKGEMDSNDKIIY